MNIVPHTSPDGVVRLALVGELDLNTVGLVRQHVDRALNALQPPRRLEVDLAQLSFCDSTGVGALIEARDAASSHAIKFQVINPQEMTLRVLSLTGVLDVLTDAAN